MLAAAEGNRIICHERSGGGDHWTYVSKPCWDFPNFEYAVEPEPPKPKPEKKPGDRPKESSVEEKSGQRAATEEIKTEKP